MAKRLTALWLAVLLTGCGNIGLFGKSASDRSASSQPTGSGNARTSPGGESITLYLKTLHDLVEGDPVLQADAFRNAVTAAEDAPTTTNRLNLALALATPGHPSSNPQEAQRLLNELLAAGDSLLPDERTLALVHLKEVEQRLILDAEAQRRQRAATAATSQRNDQSAQRLAAALEENRQLRAELDAARARLDAIMNIERSIRERENGSNPN